MPKLSVGIGVNCESCGKTSGHSDASGRMRCDKCGRFAEREPSYCAEHEVDIDNVPGYDTCPYCDERRRVEQMEQEMHARRADPSMHPSVDAPRW